MPSAAMLFVLVFFFMVFGGPWYVIRLVEGRRKYLLDLRKEEARIAEARARELELAQRRAELEYREALLELERFDRRTAGLDPPRKPPTPGLDEE